MNDKKAQSFLHAPAEEICLRRKSRRRTLLSSSTAPVKENRNRERERVYDWVKRNNLYSLAGR